MARLCGLALLCLVSRAYSQDSAPLPVIHPNQEVRVPHLPVLRARSKDVRMSC